MNHKSQITIFIIFGIVLLVLLLLFQIVISAHDLKDNNKEPIQIYILANLKEVSIEALRNISRQGGHYNDYENIHEDNVAILLDGDKSKLLSLQEIEDSLSEYVNDNLHLNFEEFETQGYELSFDEIKTKTEINKDNVVFTIISKFKVKKENQITYIKDINVKHNINLKGIYELVEDTIKLNINTDETFDTKYVDDFVTNLTKADDIVVFSVEEPYTELKEVIFVFGIRGVAD